MRSRNHVDTKTLAVAFAFSVFAACGSYDEPGFTTTPTQNPIARIESQQTRMQMPPVVSRLPRDVRPLRYRLNLEIFPERETFSGVAEIVVSLERPRRELYLHSGPFQISHVSIDLPGAQRPIAIAFVPVDRTGLAAVFLRRELQPGTYTLRVAYTAPFDRTLRGLYRVRQAGESYAFTQFEPTMARYAFPCFDEPSFKAPFEVTLTVHENDVAVANSPMVTESRRGGLKRVRFAPTPPLPTYLVAWAVGPLDIVEGMTLPRTSSRMHSVPIRGLAAKGQGRQLAFALREIPELIAALEAYFAFPYPFEKLDIVAVPDFAHAGMENAGLVTFGERYLLLGSDASETQRRAFTSVMAHELTHQWFGNLVTMEWWDDLWLNEAFATWLGSKIVHQLYPEQQARLALLEDVQSAMGMDSLVSARQVRQPIETLHDVDNAADAITYDKGGGVLSMFEHWLTEETFREGIRRYVRAHAWANATAADLFTALSEASGRDVAAPFRTFIEQPGVPLVHTSIACGVDGASISFEQSRYLPLGSTGNRVGSWQIPVCIRYGARNRQESQCTVLAGARTTLALEGDCPSWVMPNAGGVGYFRFSLTTENLRALTTQGWSHLTPTEKLAVADSLSAGFESGIISAEEAFRALTAFALEPMDALAEAPMRLLALVRSHVVSPHERSRVEQYAQRLYQPLFQRLGWDRASSSPLSSEERMLQSSVTDFLAFDALDPAVRRDAAQRGRAYVGFLADGALHPEVVSPDAVGAAVGVAVQDGDAAFFDAVLDHIVASEDATVRSELLYSLGRVQEPHLAERARELAFDPRVRLDETFLTLHAQLRMPETRDATWEWIQRNAATLENRRPQLLAGTVHILSGALCSEEAAERLAAFFEPRINAAMGGPRDLAIAIEVIRLCAARAAAQRESSGRFFSRQ